MSTIKHFHENSLAAISWGGLETTASLLTLNAFLVATLLLLLILILLLLCRLIYRNKSKQELRLNLGLGWAVFEQPGPGTFYDHSITAINHFRTVNHSRTAINHSRTAYLVTGPPSVPLNASGDAVVTLSWVGTVGPTPTRANDNKGKKDGGQDHCWR